MCSWGGSPVSLWNKSGHGIIFRHVRILCIGVFASINRNEIYSSSLLRRDRKP